MTSAEPSGSFWDYALRLYAAPGVQAACLDLQDRGGADVNLLLYACWRGAGGLRLDHGDWDAALAATGRWNAGVVQPLRAVRRALKVPPEGYANDATRTLRERVAELELAAERAEIERLAALPAPAGQAVPADALASNLEACARRLAPAGGYAAPLAVLAAAALG